MAVKSCTVYAPATVANVGCGFDIFGFALESPGDEVTATFSSSPGITIESISGDRGKLSRDPAKNTASVAASSLLNKLNETRGVALSINKRMPMGSGMGSSAASSVAAVVAVNHLLGSPVKHEDLIQYALAGERLACDGKTPHADNIAACLFGGFIAVRGYDPLDIIRIPCPPSLYYTVVHPEIVVKTAHARAMLKKNVPLHDLVAQTGNVAGLIAGLYSADYDLIGRSLKDIIIEPQRAQLITGFDSVKSAAIKAGALGASISGSGPAVFALSKSAADSGNISKAMIEAFGALEIKCSAFQGRVGGKGATVIR